jgi:Concanavalin A-like lectin/glucanases superfamily/Calx-beta domain
MNSSYQINDQFLVETTIALNPLNLSNLEQAFNLVSGYLSNFASLTDNQQKLALAFGENFDTLTANTILESFKNSNYSIIPTIEIVADSILNGANGAFSIEKNRIYLSESLINNANFNLIVKVILEEIGHKIDSIINEVDSEGDEGQLFSAVVRGESLSATELTAIKQEDDHAIVTLDGVSRAIEMNNNNAIQFNGTNQQADLGTWFNYQNFTLEMWVKPGATQVTYANIIDNNHTNDRSWVVQQRGSITNNYYCYVNGSPSVDISFVLTPNTWQHLAFVKDVNSVSVYRDGVLVGSSPYSGSINYDGSQFLRLGNWGGGGRNWNGSMDEVRIWNTPRTASEIANNFNRSVVSNSTGLVAYYHFDEGTGTTSADVTNNRHTATLINSPTWITETPTLVNPQSGVISFDRNTYSANENGTANIILNRTGGSDGEVSVILTPSDGTAIAPNDYNNTPIHITFAPGETSKIVNIPLVNDTIYEVNETLNLTLSDPSGGAILGG